MKERRRTAPVRLLWLYLPVAILTLAFLTAAAVSPVAFQKVNAIRVRANGEACSAPDLAEYLDVDRVIGAIPYLESPGDVFSVSPEEKHRRTILEGDGNCSNLVFGLSYDLIQKGIDFEVVHLLPSGFLAGEGHTVLRVPMVLNGERFLGILDVLNAGVPVAASGPIDLGELRITDDISVLPLNPRRPPQNVYYGAEFLRGTVDGCISSSEIEAYFSFLDRFYVPLGSRIIEKYAFDGLALAVGAYPTIRVSTPAFDTLFEDRMGVYYGFRSALWWFRIVMVFGPVALVFELVQARRAVRIQSTHRPSTPP